MNIFNQVELRRPSRNTFDLSHDRKFSMKMGNLTPILAMECVPGDSIKTLKPAQLVRFAPMIAPVMHSITVYTHYFFVPNRILWPNWESFITGGEDGDDESVAPYLETQVEEGSLLDYLGLPTLEGQTTQVSALPSAAYQKIYYEYYRDQNLVTVGPGAGSGNLEDGDNSGTSVNTLRIRAWQHDYFTSALPWTQKGAEATIPLGQTADLNFIEGQPNVIYKNDAPFANTIFNSIGVQATSTENNFGPAGVDEAGAVSTISIDNTNSLSVDLSSATAASINDLRNAFRLQEWLEKNARGGSRYTESVMSHFGVRTGDARLNRPEFIGGTKSPVRISEVLQTSGTAPADGYTPTPQANMAGHGVAVSGGTNLRYQVKEHGYVIGIMSIMPKSGYQTGIPKHFLRTDKFDYYWPSFANLGEQPILNKELYLDPTDGLDDETFGYIPRYSAYKYIPSSVHGEFRSTLEFWHLSRKFENRPVLNSQFVSCFPEETKRIFAVTDTDTDDLYIHLHTTIKISRLMPYFGTPRGV